MFVQSCICPVSIKNDSTNFLTLSKFFANLDFTGVNVSVCVNITLRMEVAISIALSQSSITITCFDRVAHKPFFKKVKGGLGV